MPDNGQLSAQKISFQFNSGNAITRHQEAPVDLAYQFN
jgi:hypothetical protein